MSEKTPINPYAAPSTDGAMSLGRQNFPDIPTKELKNLRNDSHSIRAVAVLLIGGLLINGIFVVAGLLDLMLKSGRGIGSKNFAISSLIEVWILVLAIGLFARPGWARVVGLIAGVLMLIAFPIGTLIGILFMVSLARSSRLFGKDRIPHKPLEAEWRYRKKNKVD